MAAASFGDSVPSSLGPVAGGGEVGFDVGAGVTFPEVGAGVGLPEGGASAGVALPETGGLGVTGLGVPEDTPPAG